MSEMVERVARAMCIADGHNPDWDYDPKKLSGNPMIRWMSYSPKARAAIEAMREPTEEMIEAGNEESGWGHDVVVWQAMIDEALK